MSAVITQVTLLVGFDRVYGRVMCYPANEAAKRLAAIAGTKTLGQSTLQHARALGLDVQVAPGMGTMLDDFLTGRLS